MRLKQRCLCLLFFVMQLEQIGTAHYGTVYTAMWQDKLVAVKELWQRHYSDEEYTALLHESIRHHNSVHPETVPLYAMVDSPDMSATVMPLMRHGSLTDACKLYLADPQLVSFVTA
jgi:serine/threonine protein kinase